MITENLSTLKIHKLTQEQYDRELEAGRIDANAIYLTPDEEVVFPVNSVNGQTGDVSITVSSIGAAAASHGTHVSYSTTAPAMDGSAYTGSAATVSRSDHRHPTDTSRAAASELTALQNLVGDKSVSTQINIALTNVLCKVLASDVYGPTLPSAGTKGRIFFKKI